MTCLDELTRRYAGALGWAQASLTGIGIYATHPMPDGEGYRQILAEVADAKARIARLLEGETTE